MSTAATKDFTQNWMRELPQWRRQLAPFVGQPVRALEIGCFEGRSACWLLDHVLTHPEAGIDCVDPFVYQSEPGVDSRVAGEAAFIHKHWPGYTPKPRFVRNTAEYGAKLRHYEFTSGRWLAEHYGREPSYSIIYVDGSHCATSCLSDMLGAWRHLLVGGVMIVDDLIWEGHPPDFLEGYDGPRRAWDVWQCVMPKDDFRILHEGRLGFVRREK